MSTIGWIFLILNAVISAWSIWVNARTYNARGVSQIRTPAGWAWIWQLLGVFIVLFLDASPWHLIWWFPLGLVVTVGIGRIIQRSGYDLLRGERWR